MPEPSAMHTAVAFLIFNRPSFTAQVFEAIAAARPPQLFVVADGPRPGHPEDERLVAQARAVIDRVDWPCRVLTNYADANLGCGRRIATGLDWVFASVPEAIVLEDDCLPHPTFFPYCEQLLGRYRDDPRVHMISGCNVVGERSPYSYHFSRCFQIWGWASWARAWAHYDYEMREWPRVRRTRWLRRHLGDRRRARIASFWFDETHAGRIPQWDFQWSFSGWLNNAVAVMPSVNLVTNIGCGPEATHLYDSKHPFGDVPRQPMTFPLRHPPRVEVLERADELVWSHILARFRGFRLRPWHCGRWRGGARRSLRWRRRLPRPAENRQALGR